jgi:hypothetical protein
MSIIPPLCNPGFANLVGNQLDNNLSSTKGNADLIIDTSEILPNLEKSTTSLLIPKALDQTNFEVCDEIKFFDLFTILTIFRICLKSNVLRQ